MPPSTPSPSILPGDRTTSQSQGPPDHNPGTARCLGAKLLGFIGGQGVMSQWGKEGPQCWVVVVRISFLVQGHNWPQTLGTNGAGQVEKNLHTSQPHAFAQTLPGTGSTCTPTKGPTSNEGKPCILPDTTYQVSVPMPKAGMRRRIRGRRGPTVTCSQTWGQG